MNVNQILALVRWMLATGGAYLVGRGVLTADQITWIGGAAASLVPLIWSIFFVHTTSQTVKEAAKITTISPQAQMAAGVKSPVLVPTKAP